MLPLSRCYYLSSNIYYPFFSQWEETSLVRHCVYHCPLIVYSVGLCRLVPHQYVVYQVARRQSTAAWSTSPVGGRLLVRLLPLETPSKTILHHAPLCATYCMSFWRRMLELWLWTAGSAIRHRRLPWSKLRSPKRLFFSGHAPDRSSSLIYYHCVSLLGTIRNTPSTFEYGVSAHNACANAWRRRDVGLLNGGCVMYLSLWQ